MDDWVVIDDVNTGGTKLGNRDRSMVVLNACETATSGSQLGWVEGWAPMLASRGFGAVVAPLWRVQDEVAFNVVTGGLKNLVMDGCTLGEAFTKARASASDRSIAAFAFMTYGDVMARAPAS
jgi:CHAT domain-containing protein